MKRRPLTLDERATKLLREHGYDSGGNAPTFDDGDPHVVSWDISPVAVPEDSDDDDAHEIAATFADLSGGRLMPRFTSYAWLATTGEEQRRREYNAGVRAEDRLTAEEWRVREVRALGRISAELARAQYAARDFFDNVRHERLEEEYGLRESNRPAAAPHRERDAARNKQKRAVVRGVRRQWCAVGELFA